MHHQNRRSWTIDGGARIRRKCSGTGCSHASETARCLPEERGAISVMDNSDDSRWAMQTEASDVLHQSLQDYALITLDPDGHIMRWSAGAEKMFGYQQSEVAGQSFKMLFTPEDQAANAPARELGEAARSGKAEDQRWHVRKGGSRIWVMGIVRALRTEGGELTGFSKVAREVTSQKLEEMQRDAALHREQAGRLKAEKRWKYLEDIFESLPAIVALVQLPEHVYAFANRSLRELAGGRELVGRKIRQEHPELDDLYFRLFDTVAATGRPYAATERLIQFRGSSGIEERYFDFVYHPMHGEGEEHEAVLLFAVDATDRVRTRQTAEQASHALEAERDRLKSEIERRKSSETLAEERAAIVGEQAALLDLAQDGILAISHEMTIEFWNRGAEQMYGWRNEEAVGKNVHQLLQTEAPLPLGEIRRIVYTEGEWQGELKHRDRSGREINVSSRWALRKRNGAPSGWLEIVRDVTAQKRMEAHLREADKLESLGVLAGGIAHDFNNLLTGILGNLSLAIETTEPDSPIRDLLANASRASERAATLTQQMLAYAGKGQFVVQAVNLSAVVRETMKLHGGSSPPNARVEWALDDERLPGTTYETQLHQVDMNLILNAAEAIGPQPGKIVVKTGIQDVDRAATAARYDLGRPTEGRYVLLEVGDTGAGIDPSIKRNIFDPFFSTKFTGRGLGLAAVSGIVRALNGSVRIVSAPGQGTIFRILFPAAMPVPEQPDVQPERNYPILVVDDEEVVRTAAEVMLRSRGYEVLLD